MSNKIFHYSNTGISSGQRFYLKDDVSGIFLRNLNIDSNFPVVASNLVYNTGTQTISGIKNFYSRPTVNGTGVLLSGESEPFVMNFGHSQIASPTIGLTTGYFGPNMDAGLVSATNNEKRRIPILQNCFLRKVVWTNFAKTTIPSGTLTGYFKNFGPNQLNDDKTVGVQVTPGMSIPATNIMYNSITGDLNLPIKTGDYVSFYYISNFSGASTVNYAVNVGAYFYV